MRLPALRGLVLFMASAGLLFIVASPAFAGPITVVIDENCHGVSTNTTGTPVSLPCGLVMDPGPGDGLTTLFYSLLNPSGLVVGDVIILDPNSNLISDILRFDSNVQGGGVFVYSRFGNDPPSIADVGGPSNFNTNRLEIVEVQAGGSSGVRYTPAAGEPGFVAGADGQFTYDFTSDVPEPATGLFLVAPLALLALRRKRTCRS